MPRYSTYQRPGTELRDSWRRRVFGSTTQPKTSNRSSLFRRRVENTCCCKCMYLGTDIPENQPSGSLHSFAASWTGFNIQRCRLGGRRVQFTRELLLRFGKKLLASGRTCGRLQDAKVAQSALFCIGSGLGG